MTTHAGYRLKIRAGKSEVVAKEVDTSDDELPNKDNDGSVDGDAGDDDQLDAHGTLDEALHRVRSTRKASNSTPSWPFEGSANEPDTLPRQFADRPDDV